VAKTPAKTEPGRRPALARGGCACGAVRFEMGTPAVWAWHDHARESRHAQGCAYATYVGSWKSKFRVTEGEDMIARWHEPDTGAVRGFCTRCGTPLFYERAHAPKMINIPRALFEKGVGREPRYHLHVEETPPWAYDNGKLVPLKNYPGVMHQRPKKSSRTVELGDLF
jgi:hypothetical protein